MTPGIIIPLILLPIGLVVFGAWYQRTIRNPSTSGPPPVSGVRLTAESLHRLTTPPWRVVYEIRDRLDGIDHVVIGPVGVIAVTTSATDRPTADQLDASTLPTVVANSAITRGAVDDLLDPGTTCDMLAHVFWGLADDRRHAAELPVHATAHVEGQRLEAWLTDWVTNAPATLTTAQVDRAWQAITVGIGRPDPLS
ncbi:MAG: hypothetical protein WBP59_01310 [Ilumatobacteraceae bacterium]